LNITIIELGLQYQLLPDYMQCVELTAGKNYTINYQSYYVTGDTVISLQPCDDKQLIFNEPK